MKQMGSWFKKMKQRIKMDNGKEVSSVFTSDIQGSKGNIYEVCSYVGNLVTQTFREVSIR